MSTNTSVKKKMSTIGNYIPIAERFLKIPQSMTSETVFCNYKIVHFKIKKKFSIPV